MTFLSTEVQHPSKECKSLFYISLFHYFMKRQLWKENCQEEEIYMSGLKCARGLTKNIHNYLMYE